MAPLAGDFPVFNSGFRSCLLQPLNNLRAATGIWNSQRVVFGGGGLLNSDNWRSMLIWGQILFCSLVFQKQVWLLGQSFSSPPGWFLKFMLRRCQKLVVRDSQSSSYLSKADIPHEKGRDLALGLDQTELGHIMADSQIQAKWDQVKLTDDYVIVNLRDYRKLNEAIYLDLVRMLSQLERQIIFTPFEQADVDFFEKYCRKSNMHLRPASDDLFKKASMAIGMRLHFCITARKYGLRTLPLAYASKVAGFFEDAKVAYIDLQSLDQQKNPLQEWACKVN